MTTGLPSALSQDDVRLLQQTQFWLGFLVSLLLHAFFQDCMGLEGYVEYCREWWVSEKITMPIESVLIVLMVMASVFLVRNAGN